MIFARKQLFQQPLFILTKNSFLVEFMFTKLTFPCSMLIMRIARLGIWRFCLIVCFQTRLKYLLEHLIMENDLLTASPGSLTPLCNVPYFLTHFQLAWPRDQITTQPKTTTQSKHFANTFCSILSLKTLKPDLKILKYLSFRGLLCSVITFSPYSGQNYTNIILNEHTWENHSGSVLILARGAGFCHHDMQCIREDFNLEKSQEDIFLNLVL